MQLELEALAFASFDNGAYLTERGGAFYDDWHVYRNRQQALELIRAGLLEVPATAALMQGLHGRGPVAVEGALLMMARHGLAKDDELTTFRAFLQALNDAKIVAYSRKHQTVRILAPLPVLEEPDEPEPAVRVVEPDRPFSNVRHLRETLRLCRKYIWWADPHFGRKGLEPLVDEADTTKVNAIRILSGPDGVNEGAVRDFRRFQEEMGALRIAAEWRVVPNQDRDWHDRFIVTEGRAWNVPPINTVYQGRYSEIGQAAMPPFDRWWAKGAPIS
jgi:hypothetical protein